MNTYVIKRLRKLQLQLIMTLAVAVFIGLVVVLKHPRLVISLYIIFSFASAFLGFSLIALKLVAFHFEEDKVNKQKSLVSFILFMLVLIAFTLWQAGLYYSHFGVDGFINSF